jgi:hypothetical protein
MITTRPTWLYKPINITNLDSIKSECLNVFNKHYSNAFGNRGFTFTRIDQDILRAEAPSYVQALKDLGLYDRWTNSIFSGTVGENRYEDSPIHIDNDDWNTRCYSLNMPVVNCENSYTLFYKSNTPGPTAPIPEWIIDAASYKVGGSFREEDCQEIGRCNVEQPAWINVTIPHRAVNNNPDMRLIITTRFYPELHDYFDDADS